MPASDTLSRQDAAHLLRRTGYGGSNSELTAFTGMTRQAAVEAVMGFTAADTTPEGPDVGVLGFVTNESQWEAQSDGIEWWIQRMADLANPTSVPGTVPAVSASIPIWEKLTVFWHEHFSCAQDKVADFPELWDQIRMFRRMAMGDFEDLVRSTSLHPAMLVFLDNQSNVASGIQENFARELMELYTCGVGHYTEEDVVAMARAWTGHNTVGWTGSRWDATYVYRPEHHDGGQKTLFGISANWNGVQVEGGERDTITELVRGVRQQETSRFVAGKLFRYFAHLDPAQSTINELGDAFVAADMEIASLVRAILLHDDFWGAEARYGLIKSPVEFVATMIRRSGLPASDMGLHWSMAPMGMTLFDPPSVKGWGQGEYWLGTVSAWARGGFARGQRWRADQAGLLADLETNPDDEAAADAIFDLFGLEEVSSTTRDAVERWHRRTYQNNRWAAAPQGFLVGALCPEFQVY
ncbi:MAG: DUF1800 family protein [Acidimicrobiales bacterium]|nr:DUF1800 family protein [Acidimicrobiales bacterium]